MIMLAWSPAARADPPATVLLVRARDGRDARRWRAAEERTRDELRMMRLRVEEVHARDDAADVERTLIEHGAQAAVRVRREGDQGRVEVWWIDPASGEPRALELDALPVIGSEAAPLAALRTAELVHVSVSSRGAPPATSVPEERLAPSEVEAPPILVPVAVSPVTTTAPPPAKRSPARIQLPPDALIDPLDLVEAPAPAAAPVAPPLARGAVGIYGVVGGGPGDTGVLIGGAIALQWRLRRRLWIRGELLGDTTTSWRPVTGGAVRAGHASAQVMLLWIAREHARVSPRIGAGGGPGLAWALGRAADPRQSGHDLAALAAIRGLSGVTIRSHTRLRLYVGAEVEVLLPPAVVEVAGAEVARMGVPLVRGVLGFEWGWPRRSDRGPIDGRRDAEPSGAARTTSSP